MSEERVQRKHKRSKKSGQRTVTRIQTLNTRLQREKARIRDICLRKADIFVAVEGESLGQSTLIRTDTFFLSLKKLYSIFTIYRNVRLEQLESKCKLVLVKGTKYIVM